MTPGLEKVPEPRGLNDSIGDAAGSFAEEDDHGRASTRRLRITSPRWIAHRFRTTADRQGIVPPAMNDNPPGMRRDPIVLAYCAVVHRSSQRRAIDCPLARVLVERGSSVPQMMTGQDRVRPALLVMQVRSSGARKSFFTTSP